jgi:DNA-binding MarR family transcriptional regulator
MKTSESRYAMCLYFTSSALARKVEKLAQQSWDKVGLSPSHAYLLMIALEEPGVQPSALAAQLQLQPSTVTRLIEKLEEKKLIVRITSGKTTSVYPTPKAKDIYPKMIECVKEFTANCSALVGEDEGIKLIQTLGKTADRINV